jgi:hypothetical protein
LGPQFGVFLQNCPFSSVRVIAKHFLITIPTVKEILQGELVMKKVSRRWVPPSLSSAQKVARVETSKEMLRILQESEGNHSMELQRVMSPGFNISIPPRKYMRILDVLANERKYNQFSFVDNIFPDLKEENRRDKRANPGSTFWVHMDKTNV